MRPSDPRLLAQLAPARLPLLGVLAAGLTSSLLVVTQAFVVTEFVISGLSGHHVARWALLVAATLVARALAGLFGDVSAARAAAVVGTELRRRIMAAILRDTAAAGAPRPAGELSVLVT
ncbi:MAG: ABC transporter permease, partial [Marmoricola sp.]